MKRITKFIIIVVVIIILYFFVFSRFDIMIFAYIYIHKFLSILHC